MCEKNVIGQQAGHRDQLPVSCRFQCDVHRCKIRNAALHVELCNGVDERLAGARGNERKLTCHEAQPARLFVGGVIRHLLRDGEIGGHVRVVATQPGVRVVRFCGNIESGWRGKHATILHACAAIKVRTGTHSCGRGLSAADVGAD